MLEILFLFSQFQCSPYAPQAEFEVTIGDQTLSVGDSAVVTEADFLQATYKQVSGGNCALTDQDPIVFNDVAEVPHYAGVYSQTDVTDLVEEYVTEDYLYLGLYELGTTNPSSPAYDLQDISLLISTKPGTIVPENLPIILAD